MLERFFRFFAPAPHIDRLPEEEIQRLYPRYRARILMATYLGYAMFYIVRNNYSPVSMDIGLALGYDKTMLGNLSVVTGLTYGIGKFLMGSLSDRSDPRKFMACGLFLSAACNVAFASSSSYSTHMAVWALNGVVQGMGWPPCGRSIGHWFSVRERGTVFSIWNTATNVGGILAPQVATLSAFHFGGWRAAFYVAAAIAMAGAVYLFRELRDTPQSVGLPSIEEFRNDYTELERIHGTQEAELSTREIFVDHILKNKFLWVFAFANLFVYFVRYGMLDWGAMYLREVK
ncbi:MAG TPA: MFS transporter, partial [Planctomycetaceae bacterium]|nr:MFS transporter [Planctomycetaceae bacterium]